MWAVKVHNQGCIPRICDRGEGEGKGEHEIRDSDKINSAWVFFLQHN